MMMIVGQISSAKESNEIQLITRNFIIANRMRELGRSLREQ